MVRVFKTRPFDKWRRKAHLTDEALCEAVAEMRHGLIDADLGGGLYKKRVPIPGRGKRGGARVLVATDRGDRWFLVSGFQKNERDNIRADELRAFQDVADALLNMSPEALDRSSDAEALLEICHDHSDEARLS